nr:T9SS type A sorting domain-containing protein [Bacteroidota bacterium]
MEWYSSGNPWDYFPGNGMAAILSGAGFAGNEFEVHTPENLPPSYHPKHTLPPFYTDLSFTITGTTAATCNPQPIPFAPPIDSTQIFVDAINGDTTQNNNDNTMADWSKTGYIYETADVDSALRYSDPIIENYYDSLSSEGIGWLRAIKRNWEVLNPENELMANQYQLNLYNMDSICELNRTLIENIATNNSFYSDSIKSNLQLMAYNNQLMELINTNNAIALAIENNESQKCDAEIIVCTNAITNSIYEQNKIAIMQIYFATVGRHYYIFSEEQAGTLLSIGSQCASYGGPAVFEARNLYLLINPTYDFDLYPCSTGNGKFAFENGDEAQIVIENTLEITPNPATGNSINLIANNNVVEVSFINTLGQLIFKTQLINGAVDISNLPNGIFMLQCKYDNEDITTVTAKFVIAR